MEGRKKGPGAAGIVRWAVALLVIAAEAFGLVWLYPMLRSYTVMSVCSALDYRESVLKQNDFMIRIPTGMGWYPQMLVYNANGFADWSGIDARMSILYSFGAFDMATRTSSLYDPASDKYSAFYGAYAVQKDGGVFGFYDDGSLNMDEVTAAVRYDDTQLVLANFGCGDPVFGVNTYDVTPDVEYAGAGGWTRIDAAMTVSGAAHNYKESKLAYLQYGWPTQPVEEDFADTGMTGRLYVKYFPEYDCTVMLYIIAPDAVAIESCDKTLLQQTVITD